MFLSKIALYNFKNHEELAMHFEKKINCLIGNNGVGKTNLLDAIYYLCLTKSYFNNTDLQNICSTKTFSDWWEVFQSKVKHLNWFINFPPINAKN